MLGMRKWQAELDTRAIEMATEARANQIRHEDGCVIRWEKNEKKLDEVHSKIDRQDQQQLKLHAENRKDLSRIQKLIWIGLGIAMAVAAMNTNLGQRVAQLLTTGEMIHPSDGSLLKH